MISDTGGKHMDLVKIGKYIAGKRKDLGMTQKQLAEKLGMSDKSVSKWERGVCLPDVSVYSELCQILGISINEFLAGEDIVRENIAKKSEENIIGLATFFSTGIPSAEAKTIEIHYRYSACHGGDCCFDGRNHDIPEKYATELYRSGGQGQY